MFLVRYMYKFTILKWPHFIYFQAARTKQDRDVYYSVDDNKNNIDNILHNSNRQMYILYYHFLFQVLITSSCRLNWDLPMFALGPQYLEQGSLKPQTNLMEIQPHLVRSRTAQGQGTK